VKKPPSKGPKPIIDLPWSPSSGDLVMVWDGLDQPRRPGLVIGPVIEEGENRALGGLVSPVHWNWWILVVGESTPRTVGRLDFFKAPGPKVHKEGEE